MHNSELKKLYLNQQKSGYDETFLSNMLVLFLILRIILILILVFVKKYQECSYEGQLLRNCEEQVHLTTEIKCTILIEIFSIFTFNFSRNIQLSLTVPSKLSLARLQKVLPN